MLNPCIAFRPRTSLNLVFFTSFKPIMPLQFPILSWPTIVYLWKFLRRKKVFAEHRFLSAQTSSTSTPMSFTPGPTKAPGTQFLLFVNKYALANIATNSEKGWHRVQICFGVRKTQGLRPEVQGPQFKTFFLPTYSKMYDLLWPECRVVRWPIL